MSGPVARNVIAIRQTILFFHASIATNITVQKWMINIRARPIMNTPVWPVWIAIQPGVTNKLQYEIFLIHPVFFAFRA